MFTAVLGRITSVVEFIVNVCFSLFISISAISEGAVPLFSTVRVIVLPFEKVKLDGMSPSIWEN